MRFAGKKEQKNCDYYSEITKQLHAELDEVAKANAEVRSRFAALNNALITLNNVNKKYGRGVVDRDDLIFHYMLTQAFFNEYYNANQNTKEPSSEETELEP